MPRLQHRPVVSHHIQLEAFTLYNINKLFIISDRRAVQEMCVQIASRNVCHALQMMLTYTAIVLYICLSALCSWLHIWDWDRRLISSPASSSYLPSKDNRKWGLLTAGNSHCFKPEDRITFVHRRPPSNSLLFYRRGFRNAPG